MEFVNNTSYPAKFLTGSTGEQEIIGIVACKVTYRLEDEMLVPVNGEDAWPVFDKPYEFEGIPLAPEVDFRKKGIDILVFGKAVAPDEEPVTSLRVAAECGQVCHQIAVFGDRVWKTSVLGLTPSDPKPFVEMPLTNDLAFGGLAKMQDAKVLHPVNPQGRGFLYEKHEVEGTPLPNLEDPDVLIVNWQDKPRPACWFKPIGMLRAKDAPEVPTEELLVAIMQSMFNQAVPELVAQPEELGETLRLVGFSGDGDIVFPMPDVQGPTVEVHVGDLEGRFPAALSTLIALPRERVLIATYTSLFRYLMRPQEKRRAELKWPGNEQEGNVATEGDNHA
jgi:hypothetical protein